MTRKRVLVIGPTCRYEVTGVGQSVEALSGGLRDRDWVVEMCDTSSPLVDRRAGAFAIEAMPGQLRTLYRIARRAGGSDIIYMSLSASTMGALRDCFAILVCRLFRKPVVGHLNSGGFRLMFDRCPSILRGTFRVFLRRLSRVVVLTESLRTQYSGIVADRRIRVVANGVVPLLSSSELARKLEGLGKLPCTLVYLSNLIPSKGYLEAIAATQRVREHLGDVVSLSLCGAAIREPVGVSSEPETQDSTLIGDGVTVEGVVVGERKRELLQEACIMLVPTEYAWEGQPLCILEAMASATVVIATRHRGIPETIEDGVEGVLIDDRDPEVLAEAIEELIADPSRMARLARAARDRYEREFRLDRHVGAMEQVLAEVADG
jgi:glycosyltransferase involved in cell wall biosynthesis